MLRRSLTPSLLAALGDRPVVLLNGARQVGKSTLAANLAEHPARYFTLDDATVLAAAAGDPAGRVVAIEVKASMTIGERDVRPMLDLAEQLGKRFLRGIALAARLGYTDSTANEA